MKQENIVSLCKWGIFLKLLLKNHSYSGYEFLETIISFYSFMPLATKHVIYILFKRLKLRIYAPYGIWNIYLSVKKIIYYKNTVSLIVICHWKNILALSRFIDQPFRIYKLVS